MCASYSFFFFKQKTADEMRISDWSSDVCSSDLAGARHVDLTAHLQHARPALAAQLQRNRANRAQVGGAVLAGLAVAAGGALHEHAVFVAQADRQAVEPGFDREDRGGDVQERLDPALDIAAPLPPQGLGTRT